MDDRMNVSEFKIWLEGYSQSFKNEKPSKKQWAVIQEKLMSVSNDRGLGHLTYPYPANPFAGQKTIPADNPNYAPVWVWNDPLSSGSPMPPSTQVIC